MIARGTYLLLFFTSAVVAALAREFGRGALVHVTHYLGLFHECQQQAADSYCIGNQLVYRMSLALSCFFAITAVSSAVIARACENLCCILCFQLPVYFAILMASFFIPNGFFDSYVDVARVLSSIFIVLQTVIIIDSTYKLRDCLLDKIEQAEEDEEAQQSLLEAPDDAAPSKLVHPRTKWEAVFLVLVALLLAVTLAGLVFMFHRYAGCELNVSVLVMTMLASVFVIILSVTSWANAGLLPACAVTLYVTYLCYQAIHINPEPSCTWHHRDDPTPHPSSLLLNAALAAFAITWTSWRTSSTKANLLAWSSPHSSPTSPAACDETEAATSNASDDATAPDCQFHGLMVLSGFYMAMILTNWGGANGITSAEDNLVTMWVKLGSEAVIIALYIWTLVAPSVFPDREFGS